MDNSNYEYLGLLRQAERPPSRESANDAQFRALRNANGVGYVMRANGECLFRTGAIMRPKLPASNKHSFVPPPENAYERACLVVEFYVSWLVNLRAASKWRKETMKHLATKGAPIATADKRELDQLHRKADEVAEMVSAAFDERKRRTPYEQTPEYAAAKKAEKEAAAAEAKERIAEINSLSR